MRLTPGVTTVVVAVLLVGCVPLYFGVTTGAIDEHGAVTAGTVGAALFTALAAVAAMRAAERSDETSARCTEALGRHIQPELNATDYQCDEYPFASTNQRAASGGYYSVREIPRGDNERTGQYLGAFYGAWRIANGDMFHVTATAKP